VRELRNTLERASILCENGVITPEHLSFAGGARPAGFHVSKGMAEADSAARPRVPTPSSSHTSDNIHTVEREMIERALQNSRFNKSKAAKTLGLTRQQLYVRMRRYGLE
jgi:two-component system response regulator PilR (NtrC family)